jgi:HEAT repeat protein
VTALAAALRDPEPAVRRAAASALAAIRTPAAVEALRALDPGDDEMLRRIRDRALSVGRRIFGI